MIGSWFLLEGNTAEQADGAIIGAVATTGVVSRSGGGTIAQRAFLESCSMIPYVCFGFTLCVDVQ